MKNSDMPAMPLLVKVDEDVINNEGVYCGQVEAKYTGLTKREHFAAMAMQGFCGNSTVMDAFQAVTIETEKEPYEHMAEMATKSADALLLALEES
jgi:hypothetical protein